MRIIFLALLFFVTSMLHSQDWIKTQWGYGLGNYGPTCVAMIIEESGTPITVGEAREVIGYKRENGATSFSELSDILTEYDIPHKFVNSIDNYESGFMIILVRMVGISNKPHNYDGGHYLLIYGIDGEFYNIIDPMVSTPQKYLIEEVKSNIYGDIIYVDN